MAAVRRVCREQDGVLPSIGPVDALLDETQQDSPVTARHDSLPIGFTTRGEVLRVSNYRKRLFTPAVAACQKADESFPTISPHDLRHTAASLAVSAGANVKAVQRMLGHAKVSMTLDVYADLFDDDFDDVADSLDAAMRSVAAVPLRSQPAK